MSNRIKILFLCSMMVHTACGCITKASDLTKGTVTSEKSINPTKETLSNVKVGASFQKVMHEQLASDSVYTRAYGLFSEGGWSDDGQTWILANNDMSKVKVFRVQANREKPEEINANSSFIRNFKEKMDGGTDLKSIEESMFDGLIYEYTALRKTGSGITLQQNTYIKTTDLTKHPSHAALVEAFKKVAP